MRLRVLGAVLLSAAAYYVYLPLPSGVAEPWKLMLLDALFRSFTHAVRLARREGRRWARRLMCRWVGRTPGRAEKKHTMLLAERQTGVSGSDGVELPFMMALQRRKEKWKLF